MSVIPNLAQQVLMIATNLVMFHVKPKTKRSFKLPNKNSHKYQHAQIFDDLGVLFA